MEKQIKILVVEDDSASQKLAYAILKRLGEVDVVDSGNSALAIMKDKQFDIILLDINLGLGMSGIEILSKVKSNPKYVNTPIVAITAYAMHSDKEAFLSLGFSYYLAKPYLKNELIDLVNLAVNS